jgi:hypothetical protein
MGACCSGGNRGGRARLDNGGAETDAIPVILPSDSQPSSMFNADFRPRQPESRRLLDNPDNTPIVALNQLPVDDGKNDSSESSGVDQEMIKQLLQDVVVSDSSG